MQLLLCYFLPFLLPFLSLPCEQAPSPMTNQSVTDSLACLQTQEEIHGEKYSKAENHFQLELPPNWYVDTRFENGLTGSDTLVALEDYNLVSITEFVNDGFDFDTEYQKLLQGLQEQGQVGSMSGTVQVLQKGETQVAGNPARWILTEVTEITELLGDHARITYLFPVIGSKHYYIIATEAYGADKFEDLCMLKQMVNTFRYLE